MKIAIGMLVLLTNFIPVMTAEAAHAKIPVIIVGEMKMDSGSMNQESSPMSANNVVEP